ncbi:hypothetical protein J3R30DRAFT_2878497 [Lentinula aciculospora]|uniref:Integral membrane protein n=1 Tax=Lentinula aciculospora TaxID=153920 RepID=A0A9W9ABN0_9AGAR|nr:hypothetical protein J3R30DRAFT_2878497 [Lentinula aciculospora]
MPSVRVKRHNYLSLGNRSEGGNSRSLAHIFRRTQSVHDEPQPSPSSPQSEHAQTRGTLLLRSGSRVQDHLLSLQTPLLSEDRRRARALSLPRRFISSQPSPTTSVGSGAATLESSAIDVRVQGEGENGPGLIDSALSLSEAAENIDSVHHHDDVVEHLDVIDPQVATANNLTNAANSILIPPLSFYLRRPVVALSPPPPPSIESARAAEEQGRPVLEDSLDRHVDDVMRRRDKIRRSLKGVWSFLKTPLGIVTGIYGFLVVFWGAAIVVFLLKIINFHNANTQGFWVEVSSQVVDGLFAVTGIGFIPFRVLDTYRISKIYSYKRRTRELRAKAGLLQLLDEDDLPDPIFDPNYVHVLTDEEQKDLHRQQVKFHHSQTWYKAHGTDTHRAFPIGYALLICCLNDGNSIFQIILCGTMWGLNRFQRPAWSTGILIPLGFICGIGSAVVIALGSAKTKRTAEVEQRLKDALALYHASGVRGSNTDVADNAPRPSDTISLEAIPEGTSNIETQAMPEKSSIEKENADKGPS